jgi:folate-binding protein YgfZ
MVSLDQYRALREGAGLIDRSGRGRLMLTGADRRAYLQGLLTNDIAALTAGTGCYAAYLTAQGRMIADMRLFETGDALMVDLDGGLAESVRARWTQFIFSEEVEIQDLSATTAQLGLYGPRSSDVLADTLAAALETGQQSPDARTLRGMPLHGNTRVLIQDAAILVVKSDDVGVSGFELIVGSNLKEEIAARLRDAGSVGVSSETAEICRVESGRPLFLVDMGTETIPLEAGIEDRAISLTKGCYVGQEIIIRVLHRGHGRVARRLVGITLEPTAEVPARGDRLRAGDREVGTITSAVASPALGRPIALASVHRDFVEPGTVLHASGAAATVTALPFVRDSA